MRPRFVALSAWLALLSVPPAAAQTVDSLAVSPPAITVAAGDTVAFSIVAFDAAGDAVADPRVQGHLNPESLGTLLSEGRFVAGREAGTGQLAVRSGRAIGRVTVTVVAPPPARLEIDALPARVVAGSALPLAARGFDRSGTPLDVDPGDLRWTTSDPQVGTIDPLGALVTHQPGQVTVTVRHRLGAQSPPLARETPTPPPAGAQASRELRVLSAPRGPLAIEGPDALRSGEVGRFAAGGPDGRPRWSVVGAGPGGDAGATIDTEGAFVASRPGTYLVQARLGDRVADRPVTVTPRAVRRDFKLLGRGPVTDRLTGDLRVFSKGGRTYAYLGTAQSNAMLVFDVTDPAAPVLTDSVTTDARFVLDIKTNADASLAVMGREGAATRANGIVLLDLTDPAHPTVLSEYTETLSGGVHNTFFDHPYVYATHADGALHVIDVGDPRNPREVGVWHTDTPGRYLHDMFVKDGVAYLAYWQDGLVILDVGGGGKGGSPTGPVEISRFTYDAAELYGPGGGGPRGTHSVFVDGTIAYVGDEVFPAVFDLEQPIYPRGYIHVLDVSDLERPREIARYEVPEAGAHNPWVEDGVMYVAYYQGGARAVDVSGEMRGDLYRQGREIASYITDAPADAFLENRAFAFGSQLHEGRLYVSDMSSGLWIFELAGEPRVQYPAE